MKRRLLFFFLLVTSFAFAQNNIYRSGGITQTVGAPTFVPGASGNIVAIDTVTGEWYVNPNRLSGSSWISAGYRLTNISGSVPPAYTPTAHQSHFVVNAANELYYWDGSAWQSVGGGGGSTDALRLKFLVVNKSGGTLNKGDVVYVSGAQGNRVAVKKALATSDSLSATTLGVMDATVANNDEGYCVAEGVITGLNTSAFAEGAALYLSPTTAGAITQTKPTAPNHLVLIGYCVKSNNGSGEISVHIDNGYELGELHDVYIPSPTNGQVLTYDATDSRWEAATVADQSATNEIQTIDTFSLSGQTLSASLSLDAQPAKTVTLPIIDVVAGTNVTVTKSNGVATVSATGGGGGGITSLNGLTASTQTFATGTTGTDFNISSATSTHTFNLPTASATNRGLLSSANWTTFNSKIGGSGAANKVAFFTDAGTLSNNSNFHWDNTNSRLGIGVTNPSQRLSVSGTIRSEVTNAACSFTAYSPSLLYPRAVFLIGNSASDDNVGLQVSPLFEPKPVAFDVCNYNNVTNSASRFITLYVTSTINSIASSASAGNSAGNPLHIGTNVIGSQQGIVIGTVATGQNVGIGNTTLAARLHVQGANNTSNTYSFIATNSGGSTTTPAICAQNDQKVGIGTNSVDSGATLEVDGTTGGILFPRLTTTQRDALTATNGLVIYNTTTSKFQGYAGGAWVDLH